MTADRGIHGLLLGLIPPALVLITFDSHAVSSVLTDAAELTASFRGGGSKS